MNKTATQLLLLILMMAVLAGCSKGAGSTAANASESITGTNSSEKDQAAAESSAETAVTAEAETESQPETEEETEAETEPQLEELVKGTEYVIEDKCRFSLQRIADVRNIQYSNYAYTGEPENENNTYIDMVFSYESLLKEEIGDDYVCRAVLTYGDGYVYKAQYTTHSFKFIPLSEQELHVYFEIPKKLLEDDEPFFVKLTFDPYETQGYVYRYEIHKAEL